MTELSIIGLFALFMAHAQRARAPASARVEGSRQRGGPEFGRTLL